MMGRYMATLAAAAAAITFAAPNARADALDVAFTTTQTSNPRYKPRNIVAVWVEDDHGAFVRTLMRYAVRRVKYLRAWRAIADDQAIIDARPDVITGATRSNYGALTAHWDLTDVAGDPVPAGTYTIRMELTDHDSSSAAGNNEGAFTFEHDGQPFEQTGLSNGGFTNVHIQYASSGDLGGGGSADSCDLVAECVDDDGCCLPDCVFDVDNDCDPATGSDAAGCSLADRSPGGGAGLVLLGLVIVVALRRRRERV